MTIDNLKLSTYTLVYSSQHFKYHNFLKEVLENYDIRTKIK